jgi:hypothetical protein
MAQDVILIEQPDGLAFLVGHNPARRLVSVTQAPPAWASAELASAITGRLNANIDTYCTRCEATRPPVEAAEEEAGEGEVTLRTFELPHAAWCPWSTEAIRRLEEACRPAGEPATPPLSHEDYSRLGDYLSALAVNMTDPAADC